MPVSACFVAQSVKPGSKAPAGTEDVVPVDETGCEEIGDGLHPQGVPFGTDVYESGSHVIDFNEAVDAESRGEKITHVVPELGNGSPGPRNA